MKNKYEVAPDGKSAVVYLRCAGKERATIISAKDLERVKEIPTSWYGEIRGCTMYARACFGKPRQYHYLHRWIMQPNEDREIDHGDHDGLNNTRENLTEVTPEDNLLNRRAKCSGATDYREYEKGCKDYYEPGTGLDFLFEDII